MTREQIKALFDAAKTVESILEELPYLRARIGMKALDEVRDLVAEQLPGHEYAECGHCDEAKGVAEMEDIGDERMCNQCAEEWRKSAA